MSRTNTDFQRCQKSPLRKRNVSDTFSSHVSNIGLGYTWKDLRGAWHSKNMFWHSTSSEGALWTVSQFANPCSIHLLPITFPNWTLSMKAIISPQAKTSISFHPSRLHRSTNKHFLLWRWSESEKGVITFINNGDLTMISCRQEFFCVSQNKCFMSM